MASNYGVWNLPQQPQKVWNLWKFKFFMFFYYAIESAGDYFDVASIFYSSAFSLFANKIEHQFFLNQILKVHCWFFFVASINRNKNLNWILVERLKIGIEYFVN